MSKLSLPDISSRIPTEANQVLQGMIERGTVSANQFLQILQKSFSIDGSTSTTDLKAKVSTALYALTFIERINLRVVAPRQYDATIKRLMSRNGIETINEFIVHAGLSQFLSPYRVNSLFANEPDGHIADGSVNIPVEIKSRSPKIFERLNSFYHQSIENLPIHNTADIGINIRLRDIRSQFSASDAKREAAFLKSEINSAVAFHETNDTSPKTINRDSYNIAYSITTTRTRSLKNPVIGLSQKQIDGCTFAVNAGRIDSGRTYLEIALDEQAKRSLSKIFLDNCINNISNLPDEPRLIAIYGNALASTYFQDVLMESIKQYTDTHVGTFVIVLSSAAIETGIRTSICGARAGAEILPLIRPYYFKPETLF